MRCLIAFTALLLAVQFGQGVSDKLEGHIGNSVVFNSIEVSNKTFQCFATHNDEIYQVFPELNLTHAYINYYGNYCSFWLTQLNLDHAGVWTLQIKWSVNDIMYENVTKFELYIEENIDPMYDTDFLADTGTYVTAFSQKKYENIENCTLVHLIKNPKVYNLLDTNQTNPNMELYENCGVRLLVDESRYGDWYIIQRSESYVNKKFSFKIMKPKKYDSQSEQNILWRRRSTEELRVSDLVQPTYCNVTRPDQQTVVIKDNSCIYRISKVNDDHAGLWIFRYSTPGKMYLVEEKFNVQVYDPEFINVTVNFDKGIHLMCKMFKKNSDYCIFTRPDGTVINLPQGIGNDQYEYYGNGYKNPSPDTNSGAECGLTIHQPDYNDFGLWKCSLGFSGKISSAFVQVVDNDKFKGNYLQQSHHIFVKRSDNFTIKCTTFTPLEYCWLQSPNGTIYTISNNPSLKNTLPYEGEGLTLGVCGAKVENASDAHAGNWSCRLGIVDGSERQVSILITVTDSYLYSNQNVINITRNNNKKSILSCNVLPTKDATIKYCRWVRPDGYGIYKKDSQYFTLQGRKSCSLQIKEYNVTNFGNWTCYARLSNDLDNEVFATIEVIQADQLNSTITEVASTVLTTTVICLITIIPVTFCIIGLLLYRKKLCKKNQIKNIDYNIYENDVKISNEEIEKI